MGALIPNSYCVGPHLISDDPVSKPNKVIWVKNTSPLLLLVFYTRTDTYFNSPAMKRLVYFSSSIRELKIWPT